MGACTSDKGRGTCLHAFDLLKAAPILIKASSAVSHAVSVFAQDAGTLRLRPIVLKESEYRFHPSIHGTDDVRGCGLEAAPFVLRSQGGRINRCTCSKHRLQAALQEPDEVHRTERL